MIIGILITNGVLEKHFSQGWPLPAESQKAKQLLISLPAVSHKESFFVKYLMKLTFHLGLQLALPFQL